jgi:hypothetical protein
MAGAGVVVLPSRPVLRERVGVRVISNVEVLASHM